VEGDARESRDPREGRSAAEHGAHHQLSCLHAYLTNLDRIGVPRCRFMALPLALEGADGSPVRAIAIIE